MKVEGLSPNEHWATAQEDYEIATTLQRAVQSGVMRAEAEEQQARKAEQDKADQERREREAQERLRERMGR